MQITSVFSPQPCRMLGYLTENWAGASACLVLLLLKGQYPRHVIKVRPSFLRCQKEGVSSMLKVCHLFSVQNTDPLTIRSRSTLKPWTNGVASRHKLKTWGYLRLRLARPYVHLRWLAMTCAHFGRDQICTQVKASFSLFGHPTQVNTSWFTSINLLLANEIEDSLP